MILVSRLVKSLASFMTAVIWFVTLFNGTSTFVNYQMPNLVLHTHTYTHPPPPTPTHQQRKKQTNNISIYSLEWIGSQKNLFLSCLFFFNTCFWCFTSSSGSKCFVLVFLCIYIVATVLIRLCFILNPGFVSVNVWVKSCSL